MSGATNAQESFENGMSRPPEPTDEGAVEIEKGLKEGETAGTAEGATIDEPKSVEEMREYFDRVSATEGPKVGVEKVLKATLALMNKMSDRAMHVGRNREHTYVTVMKNLIEGWDPGADSEKMFERINEEFERFKNESRDGYAVVKNEAAEIVADDPSEAAA